MSVFISHSSKDKPAVEALATALRARGIDVWLDKWEIGPGDDIVASINAGPRRGRLRDHRLLEAVLGKPLGAGGGELPAVRAHRGRQGADPGRSSAATTFGCRRCSGRSPVAASTRWTRSPTPSSVGVAGRRRFAGGAPIEQAGTGEADAGRPRAACRWRSGSATPWPARRPIPALPRAVVEGQADFLRSVRYGLRRDASAAERRTVEAGLNAFGRHLATLCLPGGAEAAAHRARRHCAGRDDHRGVLRGR